MEGTPSAPVVKDGKVYVVSGSEGNLLAIDAADGSNIWRYEALEFFEYKPIVFNNTVYAIGDKLVAVNASDGTLRWSDDSKYWSSNIIPHNNTLFVGYGNGVARLNADNGDILWEIDLFDQTLSNVLCYDDQKLFIGPSGNVRGENLDEPSKKVLSIDVDDGSVIWEHQLESILESAPSLSENTLYIPASELIAVNTDDGSVRWRRQIDTPHSVAVPDTTHRQYFEDGESTTRKFVYVVSEDSRLYALDQTDGSTFWTVDGVDTDPISVNGQVIASGSDGVLSVHDYDGSELWKVTDDVDGKTAAAVVDETVYIGADDLLALAPESDIIPEVDTSSTNPDTDSDTTNPNQSDAFDDRQRLYLTGGLGVAGAALSAYWWTTRSKTNSPMPMKTKTVLECPNCGTQTNTKIHSIGEVCTECNKGYLSEDGTEIDVTDY